MWPALFRKANKIIINEDCPFRQSSLTLHPKIKHNKKMKIKSIFALFALMLGMFLLTACGDDEEATPQNTVNQEVVGTYSGWSHLTTNFLNKNYADNTIALVLAEDGTLTATYKNQVWGVATIKGINASRDAESNGYQLAGGEGSFVMNNPRDNSTQEFSCNLQSGTISADKKEMKVVILANMTTAGAHGEMTFTFQTGDMPTE